MSKNLDPNIQLEKQNIRPLKGNEILQEKPWIGKARAGMRRRRSPPINPAITQTSELSKKIREVSKIEKKVISHPDFTTPVQSVNSPSAGVINRTPMIKYIPFYPDPTFRPPPKPVRTPMPGSSESTDINLEISIDFKENLPFQEGVISETYQRPEKSFFQEPGKLESLVNTGNLVQKSLPKQADIDKILKIIQRKVLKVTHLPVMIKEIQAGYIVSPYFKDIYLYLAQNKLPSTKTAIQKVEALAEKYILLDSLLFKIITTPEKETALLAIPEICADKIITFYHSSLFAGQQGVIKTYLTISDKFFIPNLIHYL